MVPPRLFDPDLLARRRARAAQGAHADFLHEAMARDVKERLAEVNRAFRAPAIIGPRPQPYIDALASAGLSTPVCVPDAEVVALAPAAHDLVVHALALHWANDPVGQLVQARRALVPDGLLLAACLGGATLGELRAALSEAETEVAGGLSPRVAPMGEIRDLGGLLQRAGLAMPVADGWQLEVHYDSLFHLMHDLRAMGETNVLHDRLRRPTRRTLFVRASDIYSARFGTDDGRVRATFELIVLTGWAPADGQPKPLRPGSASARLAEALASTEHSTGVRAGDG